MHTHADRCKSLYPAGEEEWRCVRSFIVMRIRLRWCWRWRRRCASLPGDTIMPAAEEVGKEAGVGQMLVESVG